MAPKRIFGLLSLCLCAFVVSASAQTLVNVNDTLYNADGTKASGRIVISWDPFTSGGVTVDGGTLTYTIPSSGVNQGVVNVSLYPNAGATPSGTSYRAQYFLANRASYSETWVVPATGPVTIAAVRTLPAPTPVDVDISSLNGLTAAVQTFTHPDDTNVTLGITSSGSNHAFTMGWTGLLGLARGGTNQPSWTVSRCVRVNNGGTALESAPADCGSITTREVDGAPSITTSIVEFDQADGFVLTNPSGTIARLDLSNAPDAAVSDAITLTNLTQITNRAIGDTTGDLAASRVDDGGVAGTQALFSGAGAAAGFRAIADGDIPAAIARDTESPAAGDVTGSLSAGYQIGAGAVTDAEVNASGITTRSKLPAALAYEDEANTFTGGLQLVQGSAGLLRLELENPDAPAEDSFADSPEKQFTGIRDSLAGAGVTREEINWKSFVDVTATAGTSSLIFQSRIGAAAFGERAKLTDGGVLDVPTGFRIGGAAASNNVLAGNGTNFVSTATSGTGAPVGTGRTISTTAPLGGGGALTGDLTLTCTGCLTSVTAHNLLSVTHGDTLAGTVVLGDVVYGNATPAWQRLAGNITAAKQFFSQTGTGAVSAAPAWAAITDADVPNTITLDNLTQITTRAISDTTGTLLEGRGGTGESTYALGDTLYSDAANTLAKLAGNITTTKQFLSQTGTGAVSAAPVWAAITDADVPNTITLDNLTQVTTRAISDTTGTLAVGRGGSGATTLTGLLQGNGVSAFTAITDSSTVGQVLRVTGASAYGWGALDLADVDAVTGLLPDGNIVASLSRDTEAPAAGDITGSLSAGYQIGAAAVASAELATANKQLTRSITVLDPTTALTNKVHVYWAAAVTLQEVTCSSLPAASTVTVQFDERAEATPNTAGTNSLTASLVCDDTSETTTAFADSAIAAEVPHNLQITAVSGTPTAVRIHVRAQIN